MSRARCSPSSDPILSAFALRVRDAEAAFQPGARPGRVGNPGARAGDGAQHPGDPRRRREPHLFCRPLRRVLDLRHRLSRHPHRSTRSRRPSAACTSSASSSTSAPTAPPTGWSSIRRSSASRRSRIACASASCPRACCCRVPVAGFFLQLIEPEDTARFAASEEHLQRIGFGTPDVMATVGDAREARRRIPASEKVHTSDRGALTKPCLGSVMFELVHDEPGIHAAQR